LLSVSSSSSSHYYYYYCCCFCCYLRRPQQRCCYIGHMPHVTLWFKQAMARWDIFLHWRLGRKSLMSD
jgi:hypothetical protein